MHLYDDAAVIIKIMISGVGSMWPVVLSQKFHNSIAKHHNLKGPINCSQTDGHFDPTPKD